MSARCPQCGGAAHAPAENPFFPFCSRRCKLVDLGAWASERYRIGGGDASANDAGPAEAGDGDDSRS